MPTFIAAPVTMRTIISVIIMNTRITTPLAATVQILLHRHCMPAVSGKPGVGITRRTEAVPG
jgi:hypothetical protein